MSLLFKIIRLLLFRQMPMQLNITVYSFASSYSKLNDVIS
jgi:hypothetical protein